MSDGINKAILIGNLCTQPELRETLGAGKSVCNFRVCTNSRHGKGEHRRSKTEWHNVVTWGQLAEMCAEHLEAGSRVYLEGHLQTNKWEDKHGNERVTTEIVAEKVVFLNRKGDPDAK
ncbi:MAG: single-stranded DNA-binding protein [Desulfobacterales bacterium]|nr:single-stranded DNA-binding protein [Desulfobacterales bacterium]